MFWTKIAKNTFLMSYDFPISKEYEDDYICHKILVNPKKLCLSMNVFQNIDIVVTVL